MNNNVQKSTEFLKNKYNQAKLAIVLGSGLGSLVEHVTNKVAISYKEIPGFMQSTAPDHKGELIFGEIADVPVILLNGRFHYYEGYSASEITEYIKVFRNLGIESILLTNAAGSLSRAVHPGDFVLINDHINITGVNPLRGPNDSSEGLRFISMTNAYNPDNILACEEIAKKLNLNVKKGVYAYYRGPSFETAAEIKMFKQIGADIVGMSTVPEVIMARYCNLDITAISCVTNYGTGITGEQLTTEEVAEVANANKDNFSKLVIEFIKYKNNQA